MTIAEKDAYIKHLEQLNTALTKQVDELMQQIVKLNRQVENLTEMLIQMRRDKFGSSSESSKKDNLDGQIFMEQIFNEVETSADSSAKEPCKISKEGTVRTKKNNREIVLKDIPVKKVIFNVPEEDLNCPQCGTTLKIMGTKFVRRELEYIPASLNVLEYWEESYECPKCKHTNPFIAHAQSPKSLLNHSLASASSVANVIYQKYVNAMPLYRQEQDWKNLGIELSRATMANWVIRCSEEYFDPLLERLRKELIARDIVHCDETPVQVLKEPGKKPQTKSYMWLYRTGDDGKAPIIIYDYKSSRSSENAAEFLKDFKGYIHSDGYSGYNKLTGIIRCGCWAHLRRKFWEARPGQSAEGSPKSNAEIGVEFCDRLFNVESILKDMSPENRYTKRLELERPILDEFWHWLDSLNPLATSALGKAVTYAINQKPFMENYLLDGRLNISNNLAENAIRPFTVGRKNWLFSDSQAGAKASATVYSLIESAKANGLNVYKYILYVLKNMPKSEWRIHPKELDQFMPWSEEVKAACKGDL